MKNKKLRVIWIIPNIFLYMMSMGSLVFTILYAQGLDEINRLFIWVMMTVFLFGVSIFGSYRIRKWIKEGKM